MGIKIFKKYTSNDGYKTIYEVFGIKISHIRSYTEVYNNYTRILERIKNKTGKIKVAFIVSENQKWCYQSLYELFAKDERFEPIVLVYVTLRAHMGQDNTRLNIDENFRFFKDRGINVEYAYKNGEYIDLKDFAPDLVFYEQPWGMPNIYKPQYVSYFALTYYLPYGIPLFEFKFDYTKKFHQYLHKLFTDSEITLNRLRKYNKNCYRNTEIVGYSKLDVYLDNSKVDETKYWKEPEKFKIIYAPHHSIEQNSRFGTSTFNSNGKYILELAKQYPETTWIFKPHPRLKYTLLKYNVMSESEVENYYKEWENIGKVYTKGDYFGIFKTSDLMITDCCSFLGEYLPSHNPVIRPLRQNMVKLNSLGKEIVKGYYEPKNNKDLNEIFKKIVIERKDEKINTRENTIQQIIDFNEPSTNKIYKSIKKELCL